MKTAISVPDEVFHQAEHLSRRLKCSRSEIYSRALAEYLFRHAPDQITEAMDQALDDIGQTPNPLLQTIARRTLDRNDW